MSQGNPHEGSPQPQSTPVESLTGWQGKGLSELAELIALYPGFPLDIEFGTIGHPPRPIVHGYTPEQLAKTLVRWEQELAKGQEDSPVSWKQAELAVLEAVRFMAGPTAAPVGQALERRAEELRRQLENQYLFGRQPEPTPLVRVSTQTKRPRISPRPQLRAYAKEAVGSIQDFFTDLSQIGYILARKPYLLLPSLALLACQVFGKTPEARVTPGGTETAPGPIATEVSPTMPPELVVTPPAGPDDPAVQEEAQTSQPPTFQEIIAAAPEARLVPPPEYRAWQTASGEPVGRQVQTQVDSVRSRVPAGTRVEVVVSSGQWAVVAFRDGQFYLPVDAQGKIIVSPYFRPDWLSLAVDRYAPFDLGLTGDYQPIAVQVNSHWRVGLETPDEQLVAVIEVAPDGTWEGLYNETVFPRPTVDHGLSPRNAQQVELRDGQWVVIDPEGQVTARWDAEAGKWVHDRETIVPVTVIAGLSDMSIQIPNLDVLTSEEEGFSLNGQKVGTGILVRTTQASFDSEGHQWDQPIAYVVARNMGTTYVETVQLGNRPVEVHQAFFDVQLGPDSHIILVKEMLGTSNVYSIGFITDGNLSDFMTNTINSRTIDYPGLSEAEVINFLNNPNNIGEYVILAISYDYPDFFKLNSENGERNLLLGAIEKRQITSGNLRDIHLGDRYIIFPQKG